MKKILLLLALTMSLNANTESFFEQDDKQLHIGFSTFIGYGGSAIAHKEFHLNKTQSWLVGVASALIVGGLKEAYDSNNGGKFDMEDMKANLLGGALGSGLLVLTYKF